MGKYLADKISYELYDTDRLIEDKEGSCISKIFEDKGEEHFRNLETNILRDLSLSSGKIVLSTGGGVPLRKENQKILREHGCVIYLKANPDTIIERIGDDNTRPLLKDNFEETTRKLLSQRDPIYMRTAHKIIKIDNKTIEEICNEIISLLK